LIFMAYAGWTVLGPHLESERQAGLPCAPKSIEAQCYTFSRDNCSSLWIHFESECKAEAKKKMEGKASTKLLGPGIKRCTYKRLDQSFRSNRRTPIHPECNAHFSSLDSLSAD